jgi:hypothetical protein
MILAHEVLESIRNYFRRGLLLHPSNDDDDNDGDDLFVCIFMHMCVTVYRIWMGDWIC